MRSKWCRPDTIMRPGDRKWYVDWWRRSCFEKGSLDNVEWHGMVDGVVVYYFWCCPSGGYPELICVEFDAREGLERLLRAYERDRPAKVYCRGELPQELLAICGGDELRPST